MVMGMVTGLSMILLSVSGVLVSSINHLNFNSVFRFSVILLTDLLNFLQFVIQINSPDDAVRYTAVVIGLMYHMHHHTVSGQNLINHSSEISGYA